MPDAIGFLQQVISDSPNHAKATYLLGVAAHRLDDLERAERLLRRALKLGETSLDCLVSLGLVYLDGENWVSATKCFQECIRRFPQEPHGYINLAFVQFAAGDWSNARLTYENGLAKFPNDYELLVNYATMLRDSGDLSNAVDRYNEIEQRFGLGPELMKVARVLCCKRVDGTKVGKIMKLDCWCQAASNFASVSRFNVGKANRFRTRLCWYLPNKALVMRFNSRPVSTI